MIRLLLFLGLSVAAFAAPSCDANGVLVPDNTIINKIGIGPIICIGHNPWGYAEERWKTAVDEQAAGNTYNTASGGAGDWKVQAAGTVAYHMLGIGPGGDTAGTTICGTTSCNGTTVGATDMTFTITDASKIPGLASLPTLILLGPLTAQEAVRICAASSLTGNSTLTVCYDGRGISDTTSVISNPFAPAGSWINGSSVGEYRVVGTSTLFSTDSQRPIAPAGLPGPVGAVFYTTGTVTLTAGSTSIAGSGTTWTSVQPGMSIRVAATHSSTPFVWWSIITGVSGSTITTARAFPSTGDTGSYSYKITQVMFPMLQFADASSTYPHPGGTYNGLLNIKECESETTCFGDESFGFPFWPGSFTQSGLKYSYVTGPAGNLSAQSAFGPNFYATSLAAYQYYLASLNTYTSAETLSDGIDNYYIKDPQMCGGWGCQGSPLLWGGGVIGGEVKFASDPTTTLVMSDLRGWAYYAYNAPFYGQSVMDCNLSDTRNNGYLHAILAIAAQLETNASWQAFFTTVLQAGLTRDQNCIRNAADGYTGAAVNSFANAGTWGPSGPAITLNATNVGTGTGFTAGMAYACTGNFVGTVTVTNGSAAATVASTTAGTLANTDMRIWIGPDSNGYDFATSYIVSGSSLNLGGVWQGLSGTYAAMGEGQPVASCGAGDCSTNNIMMALAIDATDNLTNNTQLQKNYACKIIDDTHVQFDRAVSVSGAGYHASTYVVDGLNQQPFMYGIKTLGVNVSSKYSDATVSAGYTAMLPKMGTWMYSFGFDKDNTLGTPYGAVGSLCNPIGIANPDASSFSVHGYDFATQNTPCGFTGLKVNSMMDQEYYTRPATAEAMKAYIQYALSSPSPATCAAVDTAYGAVYGKPSATAPGYYSDIHYVANELSDASLASYKWSGFFFGMGMAAQWPAVRAQICNGTSTAPVISVTSVVSGKSVE